MAEKETYDCIIWGIGKEYDLIYNQLLYEQMKNNIRIRALVCRKEDKYCAFKDGICVVTKEDLQVDIIDFVIVSSSKYFDKIKMEAAEIGFRENQMVDGSVFNYPFFDFKRYASLRINPVTILSNDCWGGLTYHYLKLPFTSPTINLWFEKKEFAKFISDPLFYINSELFMIREGDIKNSITPVGGLGSGINKTVEVCFNHSPTFEIAKKDWDRRKQRVNENNLFVKASMYAYDDEETQNELIAAYQKFQGKKVMFYMGDKVVKNKFSSVRFLKMNEKFVKYAEYERYLRLHKYEDFDVFKLLTENKNYSRYGD